MKSTEPQPLADIDLKLKDIFSSHPSVEMAFLFGSLAAGQGRMESDLDFAVATTNPLTPQTKIELIEDLAVAIGRPVDLIDLAQAHGPLLQQIVTKGRVILSKNRTLYAELLRRVAYDEADVMPYYRRILAERRQAWIGT
ncbi:MAG: nucleotidyltransferase domain-containing protein [Nitrospira sp.]|nr:nucleotidyltransferase domain-containing protein [Nitrospira sp.]